MIVIKKIDKLSFFGCFFDALYLLSKVIGVQMLALGFDWEWNNLITAKKPHRSWLGLEPRSL